MADPAPPLITATQLELRLSNSVYVRVFNDFGSGDALAEAVNQVLIDASSRVRGALANIYAIDELVASNPIFAQELRRITLDVAHAMCAIRNPHVVMLDGERLMCVADNELMKLIQKRTTLVSDPANPDTDETAPGDGSIGYVVSGDTRSW